MGCLPCKTAKSRNNKLSADIRSTEIQHTNSGHSLSNKLLSDYTDEMSYNNTNSKLQRNNSNGQVISYETYQSPMAPVTNESNKLKRNPSVNETSPALTRKEDNKKLSTTAEALPSKVTTAYGTSVLQFEHAFKQNNFKKRGQMVNQAIY